MRVLFVSRKKESDFGGLSRFAKEITKHFPKEALLLAPDNIFFPLNLDHIHLCDMTLLPLGILLKLFLRKPLTVTAQGKDVVFQNILYKSLINYCLKYCDGIVCSSKIIKYALKKRFPQTKNILIIYQGICLEWAQNPSPFPLPSSKESIILISLGNLVERKGHFWFIENVMTKLPKKFKYFIVGDGPQKTQIRKAIERNHLEKRVFLLGQLPDSKLSFALKKANIFISPNQKVNGDIEGLGMAWAEAAAFGLPVIASKVDGVPEIIINNRNGLIIHPTSQAFIETILKMKNPKTRKLLGKKASIFTKNNFSWEKSAKSYLKFFKTVS